MRIAAIAVACLPFVFLEIGLRVFARTPEAIENLDQDPFVDLHQLKPLFIFDQSTDRWKISPSRYNFFRPASFPAKKSPNTRRIFVLGGSTVQGRPYSTETAFSTWLQFRLQTAAPQWNYEVINCGGISYASYRVAKVLAEVLRHEPDAIVLYTGHNEFLEDRTYADVRHLSLAGRVANSIAARLHTVQWIKRKVAAAPQRTNLAAEVDTKLDHAGGLESYRRDPIWRDAVEKHFALKLNQMVASVRQAGIPLVLCVPTSDIVDTPPIKTQMKPGLSPKRQIEFESQMAIASDESALVPTRIAAAAKCLAIDDKHAGAHYILGRLLYQRGEVQAAAQHLVLARDNDVCPLRATTPIVAAVWEVVRDPKVADNVILIDTESLLDRRGPSDQTIPDGITDPERFADHLHPTIAAHQDIAAAISQALTTSVWKSAADNAEKSYQTLAREHLDSLDEAYYARGKQRLEGLYRWATGRAGKLGTQNKQP